jgi:hypothetical protein
LLSFQNRTHYIPLSSKLLSEKYMIEDKKTDCGCADKKEEKIEAKGCCE